MIVLPFDNHHQHTISEQIIYLHFQFSTTMASQPFAVTEYSNKFEIFRSYRLWGKRGLLDGLVFHVYIGFQKIDIF
jgi:hypothetical protein